MFKTLCLSLFQGKYMDIEFDYKGDPIGGVITNCKSFYNIQSARCLSMQYTVVDV